MLRRNWVALIPVALALIFFWIRAEAGVISEADITYKHFISHPRLLELPGEVPKDALNLHLLLKPDQCPVYWDNNISMVGVQDKVDWVSYQAEAGLRLAPVDVFYGHQSQHALDHMHPLFWPVQDYLGLRVRLK